VIHQMVSDLPTQNCSSTTRPPSGTMIQTLSHIKLMKCACIHVAQVPDEYELCQASCTLCF